MSTVNKILVGVTVGAILGILYAPNKGSITRRKLSRTGNDLRDKLNNFKEAINEKIDSLKEDVEDIAYQESVIVEEEAAAKQPSWQSEN